MAKMEKRSLLVTGGAGFIGSTFVRQAVERGDSVVVLDALTYAGHRANLEGIDGPGSFELVVGDICDKDLVPRLLHDHATHAIVNFAAESHVDRSISGPAPFLETNVFGTFNLLDAAHYYWRGLPEGRKEKFRYVQVSTDEVYGSLPEDSSDKFSEASPLAPNSPYSASKAAGDLFARAWHHTYGLPVVITNCSNNYGPRQYPEKLIPFMIHCALDGKPLGVYGDGRNVRDWIHVEDHSAGVMLALEKGRPGSTYCFGGNAERRNLDVVLTLCRELDLLRPRLDRKPHESAIRFVADRLGHDRRYAIDDSLAVRELGFKRRHTIERGLADTVKWYVENQRWCKTVLKDKEGA